MKTLLFLNVCLYTYVMVVHVRLLHGYVWAYVLGQPVAEGAYDNTMQSHLPTGDAEGDPYPWRHVNDVSAKQNNSNNSLSDSMKETRRWRPCLSNRACGRGRFCDHHYGTCLPHVQQGSPCRRDAHCRRHHECVHGRCRQVVPLPHPGARCRHDMDCGSNGCCSRRHGEKICQRRLVSGAACYVPPGGLSYSLNQLCPCLPGLLCVDTRQQPSYNKTQEEEYVVTNGRRFSPRHLRCIPP